MKPVIPPALLEHWHSRHGSFAPVPSGRHNVNLKKWLRGLPCFYCDGPGGTIDHYIPLALGGTSARENLRPCCRPCNEAKADTHPHNWTDR